MWDHLPPPFLYPEQMVATGAGFSTFLDFVLLLVVFLSEETGFHTINSQIFIRWHNCLLFFSSLDNQCRRLPTSIRQLTGFAFWCRLRLYNSHNQSFVSLLESSTISALWRRMVCSTRFLGHSLLLAVCSPWQFIKVGVSEQSCLKCPPLRIEPSQHFLAYICLSYVQSGDI